MILGTAAYMAPEQARGKAVDKRADIWAFGVVVFEMLTGRRPFEGEVISDVLAAVLKTEPHWQALRVDTPAALQRLLRRCLEKDPRHRLQAIGEARAQIDDLLNGVPEETGVPAIPHARSLWQRGWPWAATGTLAAGLAAVLVFWVPWRKASPSAPLRLEATLGADAALVIATGGAGAPAGNAIAVSPDGSQLAFAAQPHGGGTPRLYVRRLDQLTATPLAGTENAVAPFFSPDGQWLGFFAAGKLKKIAVTGGASIPLADAQGARGGSWAEDGTIVFTPNSPDNGLWRVPAAGGTAERLTTLAPGETTHRWPQMLPGGRAVLYTVSETTGIFANAWLAVQPLPTGTPHIVQRGGYFGRYFPSGLGSPTRAAREGGHLTWVHDGTLFAAPFDLATLAVTGPAVPVVPGVLSFNNSGNAQVEVSATGTLAYLPGGEYGSAAPLDWLTRDGKTTPLRATPANWGGVQIAPDGRRLAFALADKLRSMDVRCDARRADKVDVGSRHGSYSSLDAGWAAAGLLRLARRHHREPLLAAGRWQWGANAADDELEPTDSGVVAPERSLPSVWRNSAADGPRCVDPAGGRRRRERLEAWDADRVSEWAVRGAAAALLAGRAVAGLRIERVGHFRDLRPAVSGSGGQVADLHRRRHRRRLVARTARTALPGARRTDHGGALHGRWRRVSDREAARVERDAGPAPAVLRGQLRSAPGRRPCRDGAGHRADIRPDACDTRLQLLRRAAAARASDDAMSLSAGTRLGPYEILSALGAGGMGEVYKARDTRLDRTVAVKVLPADLAADPDRARAIRARGAGDCGAVASAHLHHPRRRPSRRDRLPRDGVSRRRDARGSTRAREGTAPARSRC